MTAIQQLAVSLTAADLMTRDVVTVHQSLPAAEAVQILLSKSISGVPVVDDDNHCVGVFTHADFGRLAQACSEPHAPPVSCPFQLRHRRTDGRDVVFCTLATGQCPVQRTEVEDGVSRTVCSDPHEIVCDWTTLQPTCKPTDPVHRWMTVDPITVDSMATIPECAARMLRARIHRLIVVDDEQRIVGILTSTDLLTALAELPECAA
jgi:CBS domain-containing protein